jgi:hypothetical protein
MTTIRTCVRTHPPRDGTALGSGFFEELDWTGFAIPKRQHVTASSPMEDAYVLS